MNSLTVSIIVLIWFVAAYRYYGRFIERTLGRPDPAAVTPAHQFKDDLDFSPSKRRFLWGNHFSSIAGAGPIIGPIMAAYPISAGAPPCCGWPWARCSWARCTTICP